MPRCLDIICRNEVCDRNTFVTFVSLHYVVGVVCIVHITTLEIITRSTCRAIIYAVLLCVVQVVETAKAGDKVVFTGSMIVIPEVSGLARVGEVCVMMYV